MSTEYLKERARNILKGEHGVPCQAAVQSEGRREWRAAVGGEAFQFLLVQWRLVCDVAAMELEYLARGCWSTLQEGARSTLREGGEVLYERGFSTSDRGW